MAAHNIYVLGQMWAFRRWELRKLFTLEEYIELQTDLIIGGTTVDREVYMENEENAECLKVEKIE